MTTTDIIAKAKAAADTVIGYWKHDGCKLATTSVICARATLALVEEWDRWNGLAKARQVIVDSWQKDGYSASEYQAEADVLRANADRIETALREVVR